MVPFHPPHVDDVSIRFVEDQIMVVTMHRPGKMNILSKVQHWQLDALWTWYEAQPDLRAAIFTGEGKKAFCCGSDLLEIERNEKIKLANTAEYPRIVAMDHPSSGFAGIGRRRNKKPIIAAVNGLAFGGGFEIVLNCDVVVASPTAEFCLPEARVGVYASGGGLPRLMHICGPIVAGDIALTGRRVKADEALQRGLVSVVAKSPESVLDEALDRARMMCKMSPEGTIVTLHGLRQAWETPDVERAFQITHTELNGKLVQTDNHWEGLAAFREKREPKWRPSKL